jgi:hypothetical protein
MSQQIDTSRKNEFSKNAYHLAQQKKSKLLQTVQVEDLSGEFGFYDQIGAVDPIERVSRHADTPMTEVPHARRRAAMRDWEMADIIDTQDIARAFDPTSRYTEAFGAGMARMMDRVILEAMFADALTGKSGATTVPFPAGQQIAVDFVETGSTANSSLTPAKVRRARELILDQTDEDDDDLFIACTQRELTQMMRTVEVGSNDYNEIKPLVEGDVSKWCGFNFIRLPTARFQLDGSGHRRIPAYSKSGLLFVRPGGLETNCEKDPTKGYNWRLHTKATFGAVRMEEVRVVEIKCHVTALT